MLADLRLASRQLARSPGFTAVIVVCLAFGIGANATVLSWVRHTLERPLPGVRDQGRIVALVSNQGSGNVSQWDLEDLRELDVLGGAAVSQTAVASWRVGNRTEWIHGQVASASLFEVLGVQPILGRTFLPDEDRSPGGNPVLVIGESLWRRRFAADPDIVGEVAQVNELPFTIVGVVPSSFHGTVTGLALDFWAPISMSEQITGGRAGNPTLRSARGFFGLARLSPGVTRAEAQAAVRVLDRHLEQAHPYTNGGVEHRVVHYSECP